MKEYFINDYYSICKNEIICEIVKYKYIDKAINF